MNEEMMKEAKIIALAIAKLSEVCQSHEDCDDCPLGYGKLSNPCILATKTPNAWDADQALYRIGYMAGKGEK